MKLFLSFFLFWGFLFAKDVDFEKWSQNKIVIRTKKISFPQFPEAFNPSIIKSDEGIVLVFRDSPNRFWDPWLNHMYAVLLNEELEPIGEPELLVTGLNTPCVKSQAEDPRVFSFAGKMYLIYNDNVEVSRPWYRDRRDMYLAELKWEKGHFSLLKPIKLINEEKYATALWQKNWTPFEWNQSLLLAYSIEPHEILYPNLEDGTCYSCYETNRTLPWNLGILRGSSPALLIDGEYLSFFHSGHMIESPVSEGQALWHYFMGAYTFSPNPPFGLTKISPEPIVKEGFYTTSYLDKKVILPGGFFVDGPHIFVAYGKDDVEMWIAILDKEELLKSLVPLAEP